MQERNLKVIEGLLFVLFILLWGLFLSGGSGKVKRRTLSLWQYLPVHTEVFHDFFENSIRKGQYELTPILGYDTYEGGKGMLLPFFEMECRRSFSQFKDLRLITGKERSTIRQNTVIRCRIILQNRMISL